MFIFLWHLQHLLLGCDLFSELFSANQLPTLPEDTNYLLGLQSSNPLQPWDQWDLWTPQLHLHIIGHQEW